MRSLEELQARQAEKIVNPPLVGEDAALVAPEVQVLSRRERQTARLVADGRTNKEIAKLMGLNPHTVKTHLKAIFLKTGVHRRVELARLMLGLPLIPCPPDAEEPAP